MDSRRIVSKLTGQLFLLKKRNVVLQEACAELCITLGDQQQEEKNLVQALVYFKRAVELAPDDVEPITSAGYVLLDLKRYEESAEMFSRALAVEPGDVDLLLLLSNACAYSGKNCSFVCGNEEIWRIKSLVSPGDTRADWRDEEWFSEGKITMPREHAENGMSPTRYKACDREDCDADSPAMFLGLCDAWDLEGLTPHMLQARFGAQQLECWACAKHPKDLRVTVSCCAFVVYMQAQKDAGKGDTEPLYVIDKNVFNTNATMRALYTVPQIDKLRFLELCKGKDAPTSSEVPELCTYLLMAPVRTGSHIHQDPGFTSTSSMVVSGVKRWALLSPGVVASLATRSCPPDGFTWTLAEWFEKEWPSIAKEAVASGHAAYDFLQHPGELAYVPPRWWHAVLNCESGVAILFNLRVGLDEDISDLEERHKGGILDRKSVE